MKIKIGGTFGEPEQIIEASSVEILSPEDESRASYSLRLQRDGMTLEVYSGGMFKAGGVVYDRFSITPVASNCVYLKPVRV